MEVKNRPKKDFNRIEGANEILEKLETLDVKELVNNNPDLGAFVDKSGWLDLSSQEALRTLVETQFSLYFGYNITLSKHNLVPRLVNRLRYLLWLCSLVGDGNFSTGLEIGVGANCVTPLLGAYLGIKMYATDIDPDSIESSRRIYDQVRKSGELDDAAIVLDLTQPDVLAGYVDKVGPVSFLMCNPPTYEDENEAKSMQQAKSDPPKSLTPRVGTDSELYTPGGELGFAQAILESTKGKPINWSSVIFSRKSSVEPFIASIREVGASHAIHTFGKVTKRWLVAWSFTELPPSDEIGRSTSVKPNLNPPKVEHTIEYQGELAALVPPGVQSSTRESSLILRCSGITWSRAYRRNKQLKGGKAAIELKSKGSMVLIRHLGGSHETWQSLLGYIQRQCQSTPAPK